MRVKIILIVFVMLLVTGCNSIPIREISDSKPSSMNEIETTENAMLLEVSLLGDKKHWKVRTIDEEVITIYIDWETMPTQKVGEQIRVIEYYKEDFHLYSYEK